MQPLPMHTPPCSGSESPAPARRLATLPMAALLVSALGFWLLLYINLPRLADLFAFHLLGLEPVSRLGQAIRFFVYDAPKVLLLLTLVVFLVGVLRSFVTPERSRRWLADRRTLPANGLAALIGVATPFCSCSAVPLFLGFIQAGVPLGVTFSFLVAAPMVNEVALILLYGLVGWKISALYLVSGLFIAMISGWVIGRLKLEGWLADWVREQRLGAPLAFSRPLTWRDRLDQGQAAVIEIVGRVWPYVLAGIAVGAIIHGYVPEDFFARIMGRQAWWSVPAAVVAGVPLYANAASIVPVVEALLAKGAALGTVLAFMMSVIGLSLPEMIILRKVLKPQLIGVFALVVAIGIVCTGLLFNHLL